MKKYALVVGISKYDDERIDNLGYADEDALEIGSYLQKYCGFQNVHTIVSGGEEKPDNRIILDKFNQMASEMESNDLFLFYFAGHGVQKDGDSYLLTYYSRIQSTKSTSLHMSELKDCFLRLKSDKRILILDACRNDPFSARGGQSNLLTDKFSEVSRDILAAKYDPDQGSKKTGYVLHSCSVNQQAYEWPEKGHGAFTYYLLQGISGEAYNSEGKLTVQGLANYVRDEVERWSKGWCQGSLQTPWGEQEGYFEDICLVDRDTSTGTQTGHQGKRTHGLAIQKEQRKRKFIMAAKGSAIALLIISGLIYWTTRPEPSSHTISGCPEPEIQQDRWAEIQNNTSPESFKEYLDRCPEGEFTAEAQQKLSGIYLSKAKKAAEEMEFQEFKNHLEKLKNEDLDSEGQQYYDKLQDVLTEWRVIIKNLLISAREALVAGDYVQAVDYYQQILKMDPKHEDAQAGLRKVLDQRGSELESLLEDYLSGKYQSGPIWTEPTTGMEFVWVPGGCYEMGCGDWTDSCYDHEKPVHEVCVDGFWMGRFEVTQGEWNEIMVDNSSSFYKDENYPVTRRLNDTQDFIRELNSRSSTTGFRLPTEAEWEYACRGGGRKEKYCGGDNVDDLAWYLGNSGRTIHPVGQKDPNALGIYDMSGNVKEWVQYRRDYNAYYLSGITDNTVVEDGEHQNHRVHLKRGGSSWEGARGVRAAFRYYPGVLTYDKSGFRLLLPQFGE